MYVARLPVTRFWQGLFPCFPGTGPRTYSLSVVKGLTDREILFYYAPFFSSPIFLAINLNEPHDAS
jgi:hypothetical protein